MIVPLEELLQIYHTPDVKHNITILKEKSPTEQRLQGTNIKKQY